ncbi:MAG: c-type cytochrome, partial [Elusimicrobia bacterium]|nr:c-type cytochrome [Elusimicrobiota bacterium]
CAAAPARRPRADDARAAARGRRLLERTSVLLPGHVRAAMNCTSCHLDAGRRPGALSWIGAAAGYPTYVARAARVDTLEDRINECFARSMNGSPLALGSPEMRDIVAYMDRLSRGVAAGTRSPARGLAKLPPGPAPDRAAGRRLYAERCARCHAADGSGLITGGGSPEIPPLWGARSFNIGAGMARQRTAEAFIRRFMPLDRPGSLSDREARDIADFVIHQPRPDFPGKERDWPRGGKPADARY